MWCGVAHLAAVIARCFKHHGVFDTNKGRPVIGAKASFALPTFEVPNRKYQI